MMDSTCILSIIGALAVAAVLLRVFSFVYLHYLGPKTNFAKYGAKNGIWAVVTGASDGIGKAVSRELARKGFNIVMVSRPSEKLAQAAAEIESEFKDQRILTKTLGVDAGAADAVASIVAGVSDLPVSILVNNVGVNTKIPTELAEQTAEDVSAVIQVNCQFTVQLTRALLPLLKRTVSNRQASSAVVVTLGSSSGVIPQPLMSVYSASKAFVAAFSDALNTELKGSGVKSVGAVAHYVVSAMSGFKRPSLLVADPNDFARQMLDKLEHGPVVTPFPTHDLFIRVASSLLPASVARAFSLKSMLGVRKALLKKAQKEEGRAQ